VPTHSKHIQQKYGFVANNTQKTQIFKISAPNHKRTMKRRRDDNKKCIHVPAQIKHATKHNKHRKTTEQKHTACVS